MKAFKPTILALGIVSALASGAAFAQVSVTINTLLMEELAKRAIPHLLLTGTLAERLAQASHHLP